MFQKVLELLVKDFKVKYIIVDIFKELRF